MSKLTLILGGANSGKSAYAETLTLAAQKQPVYLATAQALDAEMREKISKHRLRRGQEWQVLEVPLDIAALFARFTADQVVLLDCLTLWLSNLMEAKHDVESATHSLLSAISGSAADTITVSNEVGLGLVPDNTLGRRFRESQGLLNQRFARAADSVTFVAAGLPLSLKGLA